jgi:cobaltochelatase CobN
MRTGGDDLAQAMALIGVRPVWDEGSSRISGFEVLPPAFFGRPRIDVTLRISGLFRDVFQTKIALFDEAVQAVSQLDETVSENPIAAKRRASQLEPLRIFGNAPGDYGIGMGRILSDNAVAEKAELGAAYLTASSYAYRANEDGISAPDAFRERVAAADAFVHVQDMSDQDVLDSDAFADHEGGFVAAAALLDNAPSIFHVDATRSDRQRVRTLSEEIARVVRGRATNPRWINGQMRHGHRGASEIAETVNNLFSFAVATDFVTSGQFDMMFEATLGNDRVRQFLMEANPEAGNAIARNFASAVQRGFWVSRRNSTAAILSECGIEVPEVLAQ